MAAANNNVILGWKMSCMNSRRTQFSSVILHSFPPSTRAAISMKLRCRSSTTEEAAAENTDIFSVTPSTAADFDYLGESTKGDLNLNLAINGEAGLDGPIEDVAKMEAQEAEHLLNHLGIPCLGSIGGHVWYLGVARPSLVDPGAESAVKSRCGHSYKPPAIDSVRIFKVSGPKFLKLDCGTWHAGPLFLEKSMDFYNLELSNTNVSI